MAKTVEVVVGVIGRPHGIRGELGVEVRTDEPNLRFARGATVYAEGTPHRTWKISSTRWHSGRLLVRFDGIDDRTKAETLRGVRLAVSVPVGQRPADEAEFYDHQLTGLQVRDHAGRPVGTVADVVHMPAQDLLEIALIAGGEPRLIPFVSALIPQVDLEQGFVGLADVPGLLADFEDDDHHDGPHESATEPAEVES